MDKREIQKEINRIKRGLRLLEQVKANIRRDHGLTEKDVKEYVTQLHRRVA